MRPSTGRETIICPCHDVTERDITDAWERGYRHPETIKRYTAVFMGPCQGKHCAPLVREMLERLGTHDAAPPRRPTVRPPLYPVRLGDLAAPPTDDPA